MRWLDRVGTGVVGIAGNHDIIFARTDERLAPRLPWRYPQDKAIEVCGLRIHGTPWIPSAGRQWVFQAPRSFGGDFLAERFGAIPEGLDILLSHGPPYGTLDLTIAGEHVGSRALRTAIRRVRPKLVVCGHVHEGRDVDRMTSPQTGEITVANACVLDWRYRSCHGPIEFWLPRRDDGLELVRA